MKLTLIAACCIAGSTWTLASADQTASNPKTAPRQASSALRPIAAKPVARVALRAGVNPQGTPGQTALVGSDDCSTALVISGTGTFPFDNIGATTGTQLPAICYNTIYNDVWFEWTAPASGTVTLSMCGGVTFDTVIAAYAGAGCPSGSALACNDDYCSLQSQIAWPAVAGTTYMLQIGAYNSAYSGSGTFSLTQTGSGPANDDCATAVAITGAGPFTFDTTGATTSAQQSGTCSTSGQDIWYDWTATSSGLMSLSLCGTAWDTLVAVYDGAGCPSGAALACNDDNYCSGLFTTQSTAQFNCVAGNHYMLQIGGFGSYSGPGTFALTLLPPPPPCGPYDDGTTENMLGWTAGGDIVWLSRFGSAGGSSLVTSVDVAWGSLAYPGFAPGNGTPTDLFIWTDGLGQEGDPSDGTLLLTIPTTVTNVDTDTYVNVPITPMTINGVFFVGAHMAHVAGQYVVPMDQTAHPYPNVSWFFGDNTPGALANYANPGANVQPPLTFDAIGYQAQVLVRVNCSSGPATYLCDPNTAGVIACPCTNPAVGSGRGCDNSSATGGASILATGSNSLASPTLYFTTSGEKPTATTILVQGTAEVTSGAVFGQGVRCVGGVLSRMYVHSAVGGSIVAPSGGDADIPARSAQLGDTISVGQDRWYMAYYRDPNVLGGCSVLSTFNATNTAKVTWLP